MATKRSAAVCLMYHGLSGDDERLVGDTGQYTVDFRVFREQISRIEASGAHTLRFSELDDVDAMSAAPLGTQVCLTFDDGFSSDLRAAEYLANRGMTATFFVTKDRCLNSIGFCSPDDIREMRAMGMSFGTHGTSHRPLTRLEPSVAEKELVDGKAWLEEVLGEPVDTMAAPGGFLSKEVIGQAVGVGYRLIGSSREASIGLPLNGTVVDRICIRRQFSSATFDRIVRADQSWLRRRRLRQLALAVPKRLRLR